MALYFIIHHIFKQITVKAGCEAVNSDENGDIRISAESETEFLVMSGYFNMTYCELSG